MRILLWSRFGVQCIINRAQAKKTLPIAMSSHHDDSIIILRLSFMFQSKESFIYDRQGLFNFVSTVFFPICSLCLSVNTLSPLAINISSHMYMVQVIVWMDVLYCRHHNTELETKRM